MSSPFTIDRFFHGLTPRIWTLFLFFLLLGGLLGLRLWHMQMESGEQYSEDIRRQSIRRLRVPPLRGRIFSADGQLLSDNRLVPSVYFHLHEMRQPGRNSYQRTLDFVVAQAEAVGRVIGRGNPLQREDVVQHLRHVAALPLLVFANLTPEELARLEEHMPPFVGVEIASDSVHFYPFGEVGAQAVGYVGKRFATTEDRQRYSYFIPELMGKTGLEMRYDAELAGQGGERQVRVDFSGLVREEFDDPSLPRARPGDDLVLTLDSKAMRLGQNLMRPYRGALVLLDCHSGAVLALVSSPTFDSNGVGSQAFAATIADTAGRPLINRALAAGYAPGSIVKPLVALALLEAGTITPDTVINCPGAYESGRLKIHCNNRQGHGPMTVEHALEESCNTFFIHAGMEAGIERLSPWLKTAGIGAATGFELGGGRGFLPARDNPRNPHPWYPSDTAFASIGQGLFSLSPLQAAVYGAALANGGTVYRPYIVKEIRNGKTERQLFVTQPELRGTLAAKPENLAVVQHGMWLVVHGDRASGYEAETPVIELAGKTGTAEIGPRNDRHKNTWFLCFGPWQDPRYALCVLVEDGASGGKTAAPIARKFFEGYLGNGGKSPDRPRRRNVELND